MIRLLHLADVHLGASFSAFGDVANERREAVLEAFRELPEMAEREEAHAVVIAGDLFDGPEPGREPAAAAAETLRRIADDGRPVFLIPGNHDAATLRPHPYRGLPDAVHIFDSPRFEEPVTAATDGGPLHVYGIAYDGAREPDPLATFRRADAPGAHVALLHGPVQDAPHWQTSPDALKLTDEALAALDADYIALGDYHRFRPPAEFGHNGAVACYSGSFAAVKLTETGPRGCAVVELSDDGAPIVRHCPSPVAHVQDLGRVDVSGGESDAEVADTVADRAEEDTLPMVELVGTPAFPLDPETVRAHLEERFGHVGLIDATRYYASARIDALAERDTIVGHTVRLGRRRVERAEDERDHRAAERALRIALNALEVA